MSTVPEIFQQHRHTIIWIIIGAVLLYVAIAVREVTLLLLLAYAIAILIEPIIQKITKHGLSRTNAVLLVGMTILLIITAVLIIVVPAILQEMSQLISNLPGYIEKTVNRISEIADEKFGLTVTQILTQVSDRLKEAVSSLQSEHIQRITSAAGRTLIKGYSITLTILNLLLLPFFIFYISRDLPQWHAFLAKQLPQDWLRRRKPMIDEMLSKVYAFFRGQLTVSIIMAILYSIGLAIVDLPLPVAMGTLAGLLNIVPYLGFAVGIVLALTTSIVVHGTLASVLSVLAVFGIVQFLEGSFLTPKILGESVGIHPLVVMVSLVVFGTLFGLAGMIIAIPAAAALGVLARTMLEEDKVVLSEDPA